MKDTENPFRYITKSKFVRSVFIQVLSIFLIVSIAIIAIVFISFAREINNNIISDREKQLISIENTISKRMEEMTSIAYDISTDKTFYLEPIQGTKFSGYEMSNALSRYLVANSFISFISFYRISEPDKIYSSVGESTFNDFWDTYLNFTNYTQQGYLSLIKSTRQTRIIPYAINNDDAYFTYIYALPQFSDAPKAFIIMSINMSAITPILEAQLIGSKGMIAIYDTNEKEIFIKSTVDSHTEFLLKENIKSQTSKYITIDGHKYVMQYKISDSNKWTFISIIQLRDLISGLENKQVIFLVLFLILMFIALCLMLSSIALQYKPIISLVEKFSTDSQNEVIDEMMLLSNTLETLKDDSDQKQRFETAYYTAEAANKAKSAFLSSISHDIRTPMNAIIGMTEIAIKQADNPDCVRESLDKVKIASQYLLDIINNVLDMSRIESGRIKIIEESVNITTIICDLKTILSQSIESKKLTLNVEIETITNPYVMIDEVRLTQIFMNILSNAIKYTPEGGIITLKASQAESSEKDKAIYTFIFSDTGIGMSKEFVSKVFDTFSRDNNLSISKVEGTGLGMAIAKNLVDLMNGTITCKSTLGEGTTFTVTLEMKFATPKQNDDVIEHKNFAKQDVNFYTAFEGKRVLVVEDNSINRFVAKKIIEETKIEVIEATNGQEAVKIFKTKPVKYFDLILMDLQMPIMSGYEATKEIRSLDREDAKTIPIFALTANSFDEDVRQVKSSGMNGHIGKPYKPEELYNIFGDVFLH